MFENIQKYAWQHSYIVWLLGWFVCSSPTYLIAPWLRRFSIKWLWVWLPVVTNCDIFSYSIVWSETTLKDKLKRGTGWEFKARAKNCQFKSLQSKFVRSLIYLNPIQMIFLKMGQSRPLFVYLRHFLDTISIIQIEKSIDGVLGNQTRGSRMVGADETMELWRPKFKWFF